MCSWPLPWDTLKAMGPPDQVLEPQNCGPKLTFCLHKLIILGICYSDGKMSNTIGLYDISSPDLPTMLLFRAVSFTKYITSRYQEGITRHTKCQKWSWKRESNHRMPNSEMSQMSGMFELSE
jgi:hypothetical protein